MIKSNWDIFQEDSVISGNREIDNLDIYNENTREIILEGGII